MAINPLNRRDPGAWHGQLYEGDLPEHVRKHKMKRKMDDFDATMIAEGNMDASHEEQIEAWQHLVDTGLAWKLQGFFGRTAQRLIDEGIINA